MGEIKKQIVANVAAGVIGAVGVIIAFVFLSMAVFFGLASNMSPSAAAALTAVIILAASAILAGVVRAVMDGSHAQPANDREHLGEAPPAADVTAQLAALLGEHAPDFVKRHPGLTLMGSLALGVALGASPGLREALRKALFR